MVNKSILFFMVVFSFTLVGEAQLRTETGYLEHDGYQRQYEIFVPSDYSSSNKYPLVLIFHGGGGTAKGLVRGTRGRFNQLAEKNKFIAIYPNGYKKSWNDGARDTLAPARKLNIDDVGFIDKLITKLENQINIDSHKIYACGISNGGFMVQRLAYELSEKIKGIGVVAANLSVVQSQKKFPENQVSVIFINGTQDPLVPYEGGEVTVFKQKRGKVLSVDKSIKTWKEINNCTKKVSEIHFPDINLSDDCTAVKAEWQNPENPNIKVTAIKVNGGGHTWPGTKQYLPKRWVGKLNRDFNGCDEIWKFFQSIKY